VSERTLSQVSSSSLSNFSSTGVGKIAVTKENRMQLGDDGDVGFALPKTTMMMIGLMGQARQDEMLLSEKGWMGQWGLVGAVTQGMVSW
jgi:hypothetical protein